jgi:hypothetical protein
MRMTSRPVQHRHLPVHDHDVRVDVADGIERGDAVGRLVGRLDAEIGEHHPGQPARIGVAVRDQDNKAFHGFFELLRSHQLIATPACPVVTDYPAGTVFPLTRYVEF